MSTGSIPGRRLRAATAALILFCTPLLLAACAHSYAGIPFAAGAADPELQALARRAQFGDKPAQLELGIRYEEGRGVAVDLARAARLYRAAATASGGQMYAYSPSAGGHGRGRLIPLSLGPRQGGLPEASRRLAQLRRSGAVR